MTRSPLHWWILCRVVDNFGDAGVCWRLARQLATEQQAQVRLFIDRPEPIARLAGDEPAPAGLVLDGWPECAPGVADLAAASAPLPDVLVSAFGCEPPDWLRARLAGAPPRPLWINLEYLSAEPWVERCHGLASIKPQDGAVEHFFFPGFTAATGGLLRERDAVAADPLPSGEARARELQALCGPVAEPDERVVSVFCYPDAPLDPWLHALTRGDRRCLLLVPESVADAAIERFVGAPLPPGAAPPTGARTLAPGDPPLRRGRLRIARIPFLPQRRYDELLRLCDLNFVRGEDSWIRAHWARRPFVWQPYVQDDGAHLVKLEAFLARFAAVAQAGASATAAAKCDATCGGPGRASDEAIDANASTSEPDPAWPAIDAMMRAWSGQGDPVQAWHRFETHLEAIALHFRAWTDSLLALPDLASALAKWARRKL